MYYTIEILVDKQLQRKETQLNKGRAKQILDEVLTNIEKKQGLQEKLLSFKKNQKTDRTNRAYDKNRVVQVTQRG